MWTWADGKLNLFEGDSRFFVLVKCCLWECRVSVIKFGFYREVGELNFYMKFFGFFFELVVNLDLFIFFKFYVG